MAQETTGPGAAVASPEAAALSVAPAAVAVPPPCDVFLSHASSDKQAADAVCQALEANGVRCWIAPRDIPPGMDWSAAIIGALNRCRVLVLLFSERANASPQVIREVERAVSKRSSVLTFRLENVPLSEQMEYFISASHWLDATSGPMDASIAQLVPAVQRLLEQHSRASLNIPMPPRDSGAAGTSAASMPPAAAPAPVAPTNNLPTNPTLFLGRDREIVEIEKLILVNRARLLTLTGFGGMGKSRVALQVAHRCADSFRAVWWVDLAEVRTADVMVQHIASVIGVRLQQQIAIRDQVADALKEKGPTLLILDSVEQIPGGENVVKDMLARASELTCLITSRRTLGLRAETVREIRPLRTEEAVALFVDRAHAVRDDFELNDDNEVDIAELCRRLEGVPLAIELAAARVVGMTPRQMTARLSERFRLLQTRAPDLPERQRALRAAIDWSYDLLTEDDKSVFAQLSVFASSGGGFTLDDTEAVCETFDIFESLMTLRGHSLLVSETDEETQETSYRMLESLREYASEKLRQDNPVLARQVQQRHADYFLRFAEERTRKMRTPEEADAIDQLTGVVENIRAATIWAREAGLDCAETHARLALTLGTLLQKRGFQSDAVAPVEEALDSARCLLNGSSLLLRLLCERAGLHLDLKQTSTARERAAEALEVARSIHDEAGQAEAENLLGQASLAQEEYAQAREHLKRALELREKSGSPTLIGIVHNNLGLVEFQDPNGDRTEAATHLKTALRMRKVVGDQRGVATVLNNLGMLSFMQGNLEEAEQAFLEAAEHEHELQHTFGLARALNNVGEVAEQTGQLDNSVRFYAAAAHLFQEVRHAYADYSLQRLKGVSASLGKDQHTIDALLRGLAGRSVEEVWGFARDGSLGPSRKT